jgi:hypothetical protein
VLGRGLNDPFTPAGVAAALSRELGAVLDRLRSVERATGALGLLRSNIGRVLD